MISYFRYAADILAVPDFNRNTWRSLHRPFTVFTYRPITELLTTLIEPTMLLIALGFGLAKWLPQINGMPYAHYILPSVVGLTSLFAPFWEVSFSVFAQLRKPAGYWVQMQSPLTGADIARGEILWAACKGLFSSMIVLLIGVSLGWTHSNFVWAAPLILFPSSMMAAAFGLWWSCRVRRSMSLVAVQTVLIGPMALWSDTVFPFSDLGKVSWWIVSFSPIGHVCHALRSLTTGDIVAEFFLNLAVIWALAAILTNISVRSFVKRLIPV